MGGPKEYTLHKRPVILPLLNIDNNQIKLEYKSGLAAAGYRVNPLKRKAGAKQS